MVTGAEHRQAAADTTASVAPPWVISSRGSANILGGGRFGRSVKRGISCSSLCPGGSPGARRGT